MMLFLCVECDASIQAKPKPAQLFQHPNLKDVFDSGTFRLTRAHMKYCSVHAQPFYSHFTRLAYVDKLHFNLYTIVFLFVAFIVIFTLNKCEAGKKVHKHHDEVGDVPVKRESVQTGEIKCSLLLNYNYAWQHFMSSILRPPLKSSTVNRRDEYPLLF